MVVETNPSLLDLPFLTFQFHLFKRPVIPLFMLQLQRDVKTSLAVVKQISLMMMDLLQSNANRKGLLINF